MAADVASASVDHCGWVLDDIRREYAGTALGKRLDEVTATQCELRKDLETADEVTVEYWHETAKLFHDLEDVWDLVRGLPQPARAAAEDQLRRHELSRLIAEIEDRQRRARATFAGKPPEETPQQIQSRAWNQNVDGVVAAAAERLNAAVTAATACPYRQQRSREARPRARRRRHPQKARAPDDPDLASAPPARGAGPRAA